MEIQAIKWYFGMTETQAKNYYKLCEQAGDTNTIKEILKAYQNTAKMSFYND